MPGLLSSTTLRVLTTPTRNFPSAACAVATTASKPIMTAVILTAAFTELLLNKTLKQSFDVFFLAIDEQGLNGRASATIDCHPNRKLIVRSGTLDLTAFA